MENINMSRIVDELPQAEHASSKSDGNIRPSWDEYYIDMAFYISQKSLDPHTKHGCIVVDEEHTPLSMGFNSPPRGCIDNNMPLTRPSKYMVFLHSEENAIINAARSGVSLKGSTFYITGFPCARCFRGILNVGAIKIVYGPVNSNCISDEDKEAIKIMNERYMTDIEMIASGYVDRTMTNYPPNKIVPKIEFIKYKGEVGKILSRAQNYIKEKYFN